ncbi:MAG: ATP citrate lyase citrate-binding domain-containing protein, partial [Nanoarchaeota archaeon]|nr:ATP citrate lyase citrate-binding domain-containing protein [Nanoarchaeota archaeon]
YDAKQLLAEHLSKDGISIEWKGILVSPDTDLATLPEHYPWLLTTQLVVKPDQLFGKRGKLGLISVNCSFEKAKEFINTHRTTKTSIGKATDKLTHFLIEPFVHHEKEYYLSFTSERDGTSIYFSTQGGIEVEENWNKVKKCFIPTLEQSTEKAIKELLNEVPPEQKNNISSFITAVLKFYQNLDFTYLEFNPFTIDEHNHIHILDTVAQIDDCAAFKHTKEWKNLSFPKAFGQKSFPEEEFIENIDKESGASLKLTILNPKGRIWNILSGGGASIIYLDTIANLGKQDEIANYGEYSGNPTTQESYQYAKTILDLMTRECHPRGKILIIGGAIANFTDVEKTFIGIIKALREYQEKLRTGKISIFVRRGGPNYEKGLKLMELAGQELKIPMLVQGPETPMVEIVGKAMEGLR